MKNIKKFFLSFATEILLGCWTAMLIFSRPEIQTEAFGRQFIFYNFALIVFTGLCLLLWQKYKWNKRLNKSVLPIIKRCPYVIGDTVEIRNCRIGCGGGFYIGKRGSITEIDFDFKKEWTVTVEFSAADKDKYFFIDEVQKV